MAGGFVVAPARLGGRPVTMVIDTGAEGMLVTAEAADALGMRRDPARRVRVLGTGGQVMAGVAAMTIPGGAFRRALGWLRGG